MIQFIVGVIIGANISFIIAGLCAAAHDDRDN